ncbi:MAG: GNAT family N-acetyltransferase [Neisseria sp.]|nr:GNAT family N-acetyltransferase [Neisseria sp.]
MFTPNPEEIIIHGTTGNGKTFRPSDWAERLCGILSSFDKGNRLSYHEWVRPILIDKIRCVAVGKKLETINPPMFRFLMDFAADNDLRVFDGAIPPPAQDAAAPPAPAQTAPPPERQDGEAAPGRVLREIGAADTASAFAALAVLRTGLTDAARFTGQIDRLRQNMGYRLLGIFEEGKKNAVAVCGFRVAESLSYGRHVVIDDIVTVPQLRGQGCGSRLLEAVAVIARQEGITRIHADALVGGSRTDAHRLYYRHGFEINAHHFVKNTDAAQAV